MIACAGLVVVAVAVAMTAGARWWRVVGAVLWAAAARCGFVGVAVEVCVVSCMLVTTDSASTCVCSCCYSNFASWV